MWHAPSPSVYPASAAVFEEAPKHPMFHPERHPEHLGILNAHPMPVYDVCSGGTQARYPPDGTQSEDRCPARDMNGATAPPSPPKAEVSTYGTVPSNGI